jgi:hypothetical protein
MPSDHSLEFYDHQRRFLVEEPGREDEAQARRIGHSTAPKLVFLVERQLLTQEQILGDQGFSGSERRTQECTGFHADAEAFSDEQRESRLVEHWVGL